MVKKFRLKNLSPNELLEEVHRSGMIGYMFNWGYTIDEKTQSITFNIRYTGGSNVEKEKAMIKELESFIKAIDSE